MSKTQHTPGPWTWTGNQKNQLWDHNNWLCGDMEGVLMHGGPWPVRDANARLIAAAPDLLEACKQMLKRAEVVPHFNDEGDADFARETIAKAEGCSWLYGSP